MLDNETLDTFARKFKNESMRRDHARGILENCNTPDTITFYIPPISTGRGKILCGVKSLAELPEELISCADSVIETIKATPVPDTLKPHVDKVSGSKRIEFENYIKARSYFASVYRTAHGRFGGKVNGLHDIPCSAEEAVCLSPALIFKILKATVLSESLDVDKITSIIFNNPNKPDTYRGFYALEIQVDYQNEKITLNGPRRRDVAAG